MVKRKSRPQTQSIVVAKAIVVRKSPGLMAMLVQVQSGALKVSMYDSAFKLGVILVVIGVVGLVLLFLNQV